MTNMYPAAVNSRQTFLVRDAVKNDVEIEVADGGILPDAPNLLTFGNDENAETVLMTAKNGNILTVQRAVEGNLNDWQAETPVARNFCAADYEAFRANIGVLDRQLYEMVDRLEYLKSEVDHNWYNTNQLQNHASDKANPHQVTAAQVGLGNVAADIVQLQNHAGNRANPHQVSLAQLGLNTSSGFLFPTLNGDFTYNGTPTGFFQRAGRLVFFTMNIRLASLPTPLPSWIQILGLPFTIASISGHHPIFQAVIGPLGTHNPFGLCQYYAQGEVGTTSLSLWGTSSLLGSSLSIPITMLQNNTQIILSGTYITLS